MFNFSFGNKESVSRSAQQEVMDLGKKVTLFAGLFAASLSSLQAAGVTLDSKISGELHLEMETKPDAAKKLTQELLQKYGNKVEVVNFLDAVRSFEEIQNAYVYKEVNKKTGEEVRYVDTDKDGDLDQADYRDARGDHREIFFDELKDADLEKNEQRVINFVKFKDNAQEVFTQGMRALLTYKNNEASRQSSPEAAEIQTVNL